MIEAVKTEDSFETAFSQLQQKRGTEPGWLSDRRREAWERFRQVGLPTTKQEQWRYTDLGRLARTAFALPSADELPDDALSPFARLSPQQLVFVNGKLVETRLADLPDGVSISGLAGAIADDPESVRLHLGSCANRPEQTLADLNLALFEDGALIHVRRGTVVEAPIQLVFWNTGAGEPWMGHSRVLIVAEDESQVTVIETHLASPDAGVYVNNAVTEIVAGDNAVVDHYKLQQESSEATHLGTVEIEQGRSTNVRNTMLTLQAGLTRNETGTRLSGEGGWCDLEGLYVVTDAHHVDNFTRMEHAAAHCDSRERYRGILTDSARGVFRGRIIVAKGAQKTDSKQTNNNLLLSDAARINTKPQLEIYADDVKCTHGATIGQLEEEAIFYLRSRGIPEAGARSLLIYAFANEIAERVAVEDLRAALEEYLFNWLPRGELVREAV